MRADRLPAPGSAEPGTRTSRGLISRLQSRETVTTVLVAAFALVLYEATNERGYQVQNTYVWLADAFLHGRLDMPDAPPWLDHIRFGGRIYTHQGPLPGVLLMPFVAVWGTGYDLSHFGPLVGAVISGLAWSLARRLGLRGWRRLGAWAVPVLATTIWFEAKTSSTWGAAALVSVAFLLASLNEFFGRRRLWLVGLFIGLAAMSRPPAMLAAGGFALALRREPARLRLLAYGMALPVLALVAFNYLRFGTLLDKAQDLHYARDGYRFQRPPGLFSFAHLPFNLYSWFFLGPQFHGNEFPWVRPSFLGQALPLTSPVLLVALAARRERWMWLALGLAVTPAALYYANGFTQFGIRYLLDAVPFLFALLCVAIAEGRTGGFALLLGASIAINAWGVAYTNVYGLSP